MEHSTIYSFIGKPQANKKHSSLLWKASHKLLEELQRKSL